MFSVLVGNGLQSPSLHRVGHEPHDALEVEGCWVGQIDVRHTHGFALLGEVKVEVGSVLKIGIGGHNAVHEADGVLINSILF